MGTGDGQPSASSDGVRGFCTRCAHACPPDAIACPSCGTELGDETILNDVHAVETVLLAARGPGATASHGDTAPDAPAFSSEPPTKARAPNVSEPRVLVERDPDDDHVTAEVMTRQRVADRAPASGFSSSDPPTRFLRGTDDHIELPSGSIVDDYEISSKLGEGAMGVVYSAKHLKLGRRVAIKVMAPRLGADPQALARFEREARALGSLHHPNIVDVFAFGALPDGRSYFVMELLSGEPLDERISRGRVPLDEALDVVDQMARALEAAHAQGVVHRDLKPSNTFLVQIPREHRSVVKLLDFGLVKSAAADGVEKTASGVVVGTAMYLSPEQCRGPNVDGRTDIYALGCVAYELVLGRHPFPDVRTPTAAIAAHLTQTPLQPRTIWPGIPAALDLLLFSMLAKDPNYRPTLAQMRHVIASVRAPSTAAGRAIRAETEVGRRDSGARFWTVALVVFALVIGIAIGASVVGGGANRGGAPTPSGSAKPNVTPIAGSGPDAPKTTQVEAVPVPVIPVVDADVSPAQDPNAPKPKLTRSRQSIDTTVDAAVPREAPDTRAAQEIAGPAPDQPPARPDVIEPQTAPPPTENPTRHAASPPTKALDRNATINPFAKRGSASR